MVLRIKFQLVEKKFMYYYGGHNFYWQLIATQKQWRSTSRKLIQMYDTIWLFKNFTYIKKIFCRKNTTLHFMHL